MSNRSNLGRTSGGMTGLGDDTLDDSNRMGDDHSGMMGSMNRGTRAAAGGINDEFDTTRADEGGNHNRGNVMGGLGGGGRSHDNSGSNRSGIGSMGGMMGTGENQSNKASGGGIGGMMGMGGNQGNKPGMGDKIKGGYEEMKGRVTGDTGMVEQGELRRQGDMKGGNQGGLGGGMSGDGGSY